MENKEHIFDKPTLQKLEIEVQSAEHDTSNPWPDPNCHN